MKILKVRIMGIKISIFAILLSVSHINNYASIEVMPSIRINNIIKIDSKKNSDSLIIYYNVTKNYFNNNKFYFENTNSNTEYDGQFNFIIYRNTGKLVFGSEHNLRDFCQILDMERDCINFIPFKDFGVLTYKIFDSIRIAETINLFDNTLKKFEIINYKYIGSDGSSPYFSFCNDTNITEVNKFRIIELNKAGTDTVNINLDKYKPFIHSKKDSVIQIHYFDKDFLIYDDSIGYQTSFFFKKIKIITNEVKNLTLDKIYFYSAYKCTRYQNSLIFIGKKLKKVNNKFVIAENVIQLFKDGSYKILFEVNQKNTPFAIYNSGSILEIAIKHELLVISLYSQIEVNNSIYSNRFLIYDLKTKKLIIEPIKYINVTDEKK